MKMKIAGELLLFLTVIATSTCISHYGLRNPGKSEIINEKYLKPLIIPHLSVFDFDHNLTPVVIPEPNDKVTSMYRRVSRNNYHEPHKSISKRKRGAKLQNNRKYVNQQSNKNVPVKYGPPKPRYSTKPSKQQREASVLKSFTIKKQPKYNLRTPPGRRHPIRQPRKPVFVPVKELQVLKPYPSMDFAEPPAHYNGNHENPTASEPLVDSYGAPLPTGPANPTVTTLDHDVHTNSEFVNPPAWPTHSAGETIPAFSNPKPSFAKPTAFAVNDLEPDHNEAMELETYSQIYKTPLKTPKPGSHFKRPAQYININMLSNMWKDELDSLGDGLIVGGQYAEPPGRMLGEATAASGMYFQKQEFQPGNAYMEFSEISRSPYDNYRHSNMAFSPQNLNDAFSTFK